MCLTPILSRHQSLVPPLEKGVLPVINLLKQYGAKRAEDLEYNGFNLNGFNHLRFKLP